MMPAIAERGKPPLARKNGTWGVKNGIAVLRARTSPRLIASCCSHPTGVIITRQRARRIAELAHGNHSMNGDAAGIAEDVQAIGKNGRAPSHQKKVATWGAKRAATIRCYGNAVFRSKRRLRIPLAVCSKCLVQSIKYAARSDGLG
jgi:hypothetical protein